MRHDPRLHSRVFFARLQFWNPVFGAKMHMVCNLRKWEEGKKESHIKLLVLIMISTNALAYKNMLRIL